MKSEDDPVSDEEIVLRLIWHQFYKQDDSPSIKPRAFHPRNDEVTGISVFRLDCLPSPEDALNALPDPEKRRLYYIAGLPVTSLRLLGLTVVPDKIEQISGHAVLQELNCNSWSADKAIWKPKVEELARIASEQIVHRPKVES
jgi:hypothetical protein